MNAELLKFAISNTDTTQTRNIPQRDPKDYEFLRNALDNLKTDADTMKELILDIEKKLIIPQPENDEEKNTREELIVSLAENLQYLAEDLDNAADLVKLKGGCEVIISLIQHENKNLRQVGCWIVSSMIQNNEKIHDDMLEKGFLPLLLEILEKDTDFHTKGKAINAVSSFVRSKSEELELFLEKGGYTLIEPFFETENVNPDSPILMKVIWFLKSVLELYPEQKEIIRQSSNLIPSLVTQLNNPNDDHREKSAQTLQILIQENKNNIEFLQELPEFKQIVETHLKNSNISNFEKEIYLDFKKFL